jgi:methylase involved in ubiquinone/menaquinone biosynthesis
LTIACAKRNPKAEIVGLDRWGKEYSNFSNMLCCKNAKAEGVSNVKFVKGDACKLDFSDETFDAVTSNYVYHNITGADKQKLLLETLRVLKKGGTFAIHDLMSKARYGDMEKFKQKLLDMGYEKVELIDTANGMFMTKKEAKYLQLCGSTLLVGKK